jgi:hypothetical protein
MDQFNEELERFASLLDVLTCAEDVVGEYLSHDCSVTHGAGYCGLPSDIRELQQAINKAHEHGL